MITIRNCANRDNKICMCALRFIEGHQESLGEQTRHTVLSPILCSMLLLQLHKLVPFTPTCTWNNGMISCGINLK